MSEKPKLDPRVERLLQLILQTLREYGAAPIGDSPGQAKPRPPAPQSRPQAGA